MGLDNIVVSSSQRIPANETLYEVVERKGIGHPDTLCDAIAERISQAYSRYTLERFGAVLRHMVDKISLRGGSARVTFGGGTMRTPVHLHLNGRFTRQFELEQLPYLGIATEAILDVMHTAVPVLDTNQWLSIVDNTHFAQGPGVVYEADGSTRNERQFFFEVPREEYVRFHNNDLRANDTSTAVAYYPLSDTENITLLVESTLNSSSFKRRHPYVGNDIKVMVRRLRREIDITVCVPFISTFTPSEVFYRRALKCLREEIAAIVQGGFPLYTVFVSLNTRDNPEKSDYYLTLTGSAIESGDEGAVGRGNRYNGIIPFTRGMSMEACCGKNPVYHTGKIYTALASLIAKDVYTTTRFETYVFLTSQIGRSLSDPWTGVMEGCRKTLRARERRQILEVLEHRLANIEEVTEMLINGLIRLF